MSSCKTSDFEIVGSEIEIKRKYPDFNFTGIVDRVDQSDNYLKIIDYKSSNKDLDISLAIQGFNIQMLLYLDTLGF
ncbi:PD-(D/E)XK nuclease family protein [Coprobacillaceae bacterium CR2/5/TPMF4]|nr:PD-(D/E)XK nuclease family protein [Coprobacillaceae bacterium CR2/5/TPMF4]